MFKWNTLFIILLALLFVEVLIIFPSQVEKSSSISDTQKKHKTKNKDSESGSSKEADQTINGLHLVESNHGKKDWELFATRAEGYGGTGDWKLKNAKVLFYNQDKIDFTVTGASGVVDGRTKDMRISGGVQTVSANGYNFKTQDIQYIAKLRKIESAGSVNMTGPDEGKIKGLHVTGSRMFVFVDESKMQILDGVVAEKSITETEKFDLVSKAVEFSSQNKVARFFGNVEMKYLEMKLMGPEMSFVYGKGADILSSVQFKGGVKVSDSERLATSEALNLDLLTKKFVFTGKPRVVSGGDELSGDKIIFLEGGKKMKVEKVRARVEKQDSK